MTQLKIDILDTNNFEKIGISKNIYEAWTSGDWIGSFNLWIVQNNFGVNSILYQQRSFKAQWAPGLLDVTAGGHYAAGENTADGLREVREELGKEYNFDDLSYLGKKLYLRDQGDRKLRYAVDVFIILDNSPLQSFTMERDELEGLYLCPIDELIKTHTSDNYCFQAKGIKFDGEEILPGEISVTKKSFPYNWDGYHFKMALLAERFLRSEPFLLY
jgi:hypothetical protein